MKLPVGESVIDYQSNSDLSDLFLLSYLWYNLNRWSTDASINTPRFVDSISSINLLFKNPSLVLKVKDGSANYDEEIIDFLREAKLYPIMGNLSVSEVISFSRDKITQSLVDSVLTKFELSIHQFWPIAESYILKTRFLGQTDGKFSELRGFNDDLIRLEVQDTAFRCVQYWWIDPKLSVLTQPDVSCVGYDYNVSCCSQGELFIDRFLKNQKLIDLPGLGFKPGNPLYLKVDVGWFDIVNPFKSKKDNTLSFDDYLEYLHYSSIGTNISVRSYLEQMYDSIYGKSSFGSSLLNRFLLSLPLIKNFV